MADNGALQLQALGARLKTLAGYQIAEASADLTDLGRGKTLRSQLLSGIRAGAKPAIEATREAARTKLPKKGHLNEYVADTQIAPSTRLSGPRVGVRIGVKKGQHKAYGANKGTLRHPVFKTGKWVDQTLPSSAVGWFDDTLKREAPKAKIAILAAMQRVADEATRRGI